MAAACFDDLVSAAGRLEREAESLAGEGFAAGLEVESQLAQQGRGRIYGELMEAGRKALSWLDSGRGGALVKPPASRLPKSVRLKADDVCPSCGRPATSWDYCPKCEQTVCAECYASGRCCRSDVGGKNVQQALPFLAKGDYSADMLQRITAAYQKLHEIDPARYSEAHVAAAVRAAKKLTGAELEYFVLSMENLIRRKLNRIDGHGLKFALVRRKALPFRIKDRGTPCGQGGTIRSVPKSRKSFCTSARSR